MTVFTYYPNIPAAADNPSYDQPLMQINSQSINGLIAVDHVTFNEANPSGTGSTPGQSGGQHLQVTFNSQNVPGGAPTDPVSILYTDEGTASTVSQLTYQNQNVTLPLSIVRAYGYCGSSGTIQEGQSFNVTSVTNTGTGQYSVVLSANAVTGNYFGVLVSAAIVNTSSGAIAGYNPTGAGTFQLNFIKLDGSGFTVPGNFTFIVIQI